MEKIKTRLPSTGSGLSIAQNCNFAGIATALVFSLTLYILIAMHHKTGANPYMCKSYLPQTTWMMYLNTNRLHELLRHK